MSYRIYNGTQLLGNVNNKSTGINGLLPATSYQLGVTNYNGNRESSKATINVKTRGIRLIIPTSLTVNSTITLNYQEYSLGLVPIGTEPAGMFGGGNKRDIQAKVISVDDNGKSTVELLEPLESSSTVSVGGTNLIPHSEVDTIKKGIDYWMFSTGSNTNYGGRYNSTDKSLELEAHIKDTNYQFMQWQQQNNVLLNTELAHLKVGDTITVSAEVYIENKDMSGNITLGFRVNPRTNYDNYFSTERAINLRELKNGWQRVSATGAITQKYLDCMNDLQLMRVLLAANGIKVNTKIAFRKIKVEKGTIATDWSPTPEDTQYIVDNTQMNRLQDGSFAAFNGYRAIYFNQ